MKLEQQVVSLELAQKLKSLWVKQESIFYYAHQDKIYSREHYFDNYNSNDENDQEAVTFEYYLSEVNGGKIYSAFTVAELYQLLYSNGICDILITVKPEELADYLAEMLCKKLSR